MLKNRPALLFSLPFIVGIIVGWQWEISPWYVLAFAAVLLVLAVVFIFAEWNSIKHTISVVLMFLIFFAGILKISFDKNPPEKLELERFLELPQPVTIKGIITDPPRQKQNRIQFVLDGQVVIHEGRESLISGSVLVSMEVDTLSRKFINSIEYGSIIQFIGTLTYPGTARNPGEFDLRHYLQLQGIYARSFIEDPSTIYLLGKGGNWFFSNVVFPFRRAIGQNLDRFIGDEEAKFLKGLTIGDRSEIPSEVKASFINSGVMHILAVSGLHVGLISAMLVVLLSALRIPEIPRIILMCLLLVFYIFLTGSSPSVIRAVVMAIVILGAKLLDRKMDIMNSLAVAALLILFWDARQLMLPGFQLSFAAVLSIILLYPRFYSFTKKLPERFTNNRVVNGILRLMCLSLAAGIGTLPFTALYFGKIPVIGFLANLIVVPLSGIVLAVAVTAVLFSFVWNTVAALYAETARLLTTILLDSVKFFGNLSFSYLDAHFSLWDIIAYYGFLVLMMNIHRLKVRRIIIFMLIVLNVAMYAWIFGFIGGSSSLRVTFLDIGQGDAIFIEFPSGKNMLIDAGPRGFYTDAGARFVVPFLKTKGVSHIDAVVVSHPHDDHMGGVPAVLRGVSVSSVIDAGSFAKSALFEEYMKLVDSIQTQRIVLRSAQRIDGFQSLRIYVLHPSGEFAQVDSTGRANLNNKSLVLRIVYGSTSALFAGDAEEDAEMRMLHIYDGFLRSDLLKVGHHGSRTSSTENFLSAVNPTIAVISVGKNNKFHHPSPGILQRFAQHRVRTYRTDEDNAVVLVSNGREWKEERWR